jgi:hypothetical protein
MPKVLPITPLPLAKTPPSVDGGDRFAEYGKQIS